jgi:hypothetical protein
MIFSFSGLPPGTVVAALLIASGLAAIVEPSSVLEGMSREQLIQQVIQRDKLIHQVEQLIQQESSREQLIQKVRELRAQLGATTPTRAPEPEPERPTLMRSSRSAKGGHVALSVDSSGRVERNQELASGEMQQEQGGSLPPPRAQQPPLSDAALLQALLPADDLPQEHREDFHQTLHGDPEMAGSLLQNVRGLLYRALRHDADFEELEHEFDDSEDDLFDDEQLDAEDDDDEDESARHRRRRRQPSSSDGDDGKDVPDDVPGSKEGKDIRLAGLDPAHAEALQREMVDMKVIQLANIERQDARGNTTEELELENAVIDMMKPRYKSKSTSPAALTATDGDENYQSASASKQRAARIVTDLEHAMDDIPEPIDEYEKLDVVPTEEEFVTFEKEVMGEQVKDLEEVGADKEKKDAASSLMGESETAKRSLLSRRVGAHSKKPGGDGGTIWPRSGTYNTIKYCKGKGISSNGWKEFDKATKSLTEHCENLQFVEDSSDCQVTVKGEKSGCSASVGYSRTWARTVNLQDGNWWNNVWTGTCATKGIAEHELLHLLGMSHEQSRSDRDMSYYPKNVKEVDKYGHNFDINDEASVQETYDLGSIMHYGCKAFAKNKFSDTLRANRRRRWWDWHAGRKDCSEMGQRSGLSGEDIKQLQRMYSCSNRRRRRRSPPRRRRKHWTDHLKFW